MQQPANFSSARILLAHGNKTTIRLHESILRGFGVRSVDAVTEPDEAISVIKRGSVDLAILDQSIGAFETQQIVRVIRHGKTQTAAEIPIMLTYGHSRQRDIVGLRDCGANMVMTLPFSITAIYERMCWLALKPRPFVRAGEYMGPCRRHLNDPLAARQGRRVADRANDLRRAR